MDVIPNTTAVWVGPLGQVASMSAALPGQRGICARCEHDIGQARRARSRRSNDSKQDVKMAALNAQDDQLAVEHVPLAFTKRSLQADPARGVPALLCLGIQKPARGFELESQLNVQWHWAGKPDDAAVTRRFTLSSVAVFVGRHWVVLVATQSEQGEMYMFDCLGLNHAGTTSKGCGTRYLRADALSLLRSADSVMMIYDREQVGNYGWP
jgi:hypothetical protein